MSSFQFNPQKKEAHRPPSFCSPGQDSNLDQAFRKRLFYPLNYGAPRTN